ncbi:TonB-dependent hemoglobin/transferrin/lactoferrin family receptor [Acinetobacter gerneri]|uniref:TonB-dependent hemoglobin/transferrin/lactoferrin family receptor n=2 Tax=Acinetobacter gerneri TaxID=202952 RepID=UPI003A88B96C
MGSVFISSHLDRDYTSSKTTTCLKYSCLYACVASLMFGAVSVHAEDSAALANSNAESEMTKVMLKTIKVEAVSEDQAAQSQTIISRDQLDQQGANDMASIVKYLPLVSAPKAVSGGGSSWDSAGTSGYNIRGVDGNRVGLDVDGIDLASAAPEPASNRANSYGVGRDYIDPEMFNQIDIISGTSSVKTDGIGGRVSFKTKSPEDYVNANNPIFASYKAAYDSANEAWLNSVTAAAGNHVLKGLVSYAHRDGHETKSEGTRKENPVDWSSDAILTRLLWNPTDQHQLGFTFDYYKRDKDSFIDSETLGGTRTYPKGGNQSETTERQRFSLDHVYKADLTLFDQLNSQIFYQKSTNDNLLDTYYLTYPRQIQNNLKNEVYGFNTDALKKVNNHLIRYGLSYLNSQDERPWVSTNLNTGVATQTNFMLASETDKYAAYINDEMSFDLFDRELKVTPGVRYEYQSFKPKNAEQTLNSTEKQNQIQAKNNDYIAPNLAISYQIAPQYLSYFKYNFGARIPTASEMAGSYDTGRGYSVIGNTNLKKETSNAFEVGLKSQPISGIKFNLAAFYTKYKNFIDYKQLDQPLEGDAMFTYQLQNLANVDIWGAELETSIDLGEFFQKADGFSVALAAGKSKGTSKNKTGEKGGVNSVQPEKASLSFSYDDPAKRYGLSAITTAVGSKQASKDSSIQSSGDSYHTVPGYATMDLNAYWNVNKFTKINLGLNNVFDKKYWEYSTVSTLTSDNLIDRATQPGRNVFASIEFKY